MLVFVLLFTQWHVHLKHALNESFSYEKHMERFLIDTKSYYTSICKSLVEISRAEYTTAIWIWYYLIAKSAPTSFLKDMLDSIVLNNSECIFVCDMICFCTNEINGSISFLQLLN